MQVSKKLQLLHVNFLNLMVVGCVLPHCLIRMSSSLSVCYKPNHGSRLPAAFNTQIAHIRGVVSPHKTHRHNSG